MVSFIKEQFSTFVGDVYFSIPAKVNLKGYLISSLMVTTGVTEDRAVKHSKRILGYVIQNGDKRLYFKRIRNVDGGYLIDDEYLPPHGYAEVNLETLVCIFGRTSVEAETNYRVMYNETTNSFWIRYIGTDESELFPKKEIDMMDSNGNLGYIDRKYQDILGDHLRCKVQVSKIKKEQLSKLVETLKSNYKDLLDETYLANEGNYRIYVEKLMSIYSHFKLVKDPEDSNKTLGVVITNEGCPFLIRHIINTEKGVRVLNRSVNTGEKCVASMNTFRLLLCKQGMAENVRGVTFLDGSIISSTFKIDIYKKHERFGDFVDENDKIRLRPEYEEFLS